MKHFKHQFSEEDVSTFLFTLTVPPLVRLDETSDVQQSINDACCLSAVKKLCLKSTDLTPNEIKMMAVSLNMVSMICQGLLEVDGEFKTDCAKYLFSVNRLLPIFNRFFE